MGEGKECNDAAPAVERRCGIATGEVYGRRRGRGKFQFQLGERRQWRRAGEWEQGPGRGCYRWTVDSTTKAAHAEGVDASACTQPVLAGPASTCMCTCECTCMCTCACTCTCASTCTAVLAYIHTCALLPVPRRYRLTAAHAWAGQRQGIDRAPDGWRPAEEVPGARGSGSEVRVLCSARSQRSSTRPKAGRGFSSGVWRCPAVPRTAQQRSTTIGPTNEFPASTSGRAGVD